MARYSAICDSCLKPFLSSAATGDTMGEATARDYRETCPHCGKLTTSMEGLFRVENDVVTMLGGPSIAVGTLMQMREIGSHRNAAKSPDELEQMIVERVNDAKFADKVIEWGEKSGYINGKLKTHKERVFFVLWLFREMMGLFEHQQAR